MLDLLKELQDVSSDFREDVRSTFNMAPPNVYVLRDLLGLTDDVILRYSRSN